MAGIAFRLQKLLSGESYTDLVRAYAYSSVIASGPFLTVIATLGVLRFGATSQLSLSQADFFMACLVYAYGYSMLGVAPFLYVVTRYIADKHFLKQSDVFTPAYFAVIETVFALQGIVAVAFLYGTDLSPAAKFMAFTLYLSLSGIWIAMVFLSAARSYLWIVWAFVIGGGGGAGLAMGFGTLWGFDGFLLGVVVGQVTCFTILTLRIFREFGYVAAHDYGFFLYFRKHFDLCLIGIFYYAGIWADKLFFWYAPTGERIASGFYLFPSYDSPTFLAYLSVVPSMAFFLVQMETSFARYFQAYYRSVRSRASLDEIRRRREAMMADLTRQFQKFVAFQGAITGFVILVIYSFADAFALNTLQMGILRISLLGAFLQMGFMMVVNVMFYFDLQKEVKWLTFIFFAGNLLGTAATYFIGLPAYGFGYAGASFVALLAGFLILDDRLKDLDYLTFMKQPILIPKFKLEGEK